MSTTKLSATKLHQNNIKKFNNLREALNPKPICQNEVSTEARIHKHIKTSFVLPSNFSAESLTPGY